MGREKHGVGKIRKRKRRNDTPVDYKSVLDARFTWNKSGYAK
jgi:hypothetical protein